MPVFNAWPERGASAIKRMKRILSSSLKEDMLKSLLEVNINGKETSDLATQHVMKQRVTNFKCEKQRRKLPNPTIKSKETQIEKESQESVKQADASVQTI